MAGTTTMHRACRALSGAASRSLASSRNATVSTIGHARAYHSPRCTSQPGSRPSSSAPTILPGRLTLPRRSFHASCTMLHGHLTPPREGEGRKITFIDKEGRRNEFIVGDGNNLLDIAQAHDLEMEGACGGSCACSTCHVIVEDEEMYNKMEEPTDDENDMLDLAYGLTETSRLGCQISMSKELDGLVVRLPAMSRNVQASDFAQKERKA